MYSSNSQSDKLPCEIEPIHKPGKIQPHGFLIAFEKTSGKIQYVSKNIDVLTGFSPSKLLGQSFSHVFDKNLALDVNKAITNNKLCNHLTIEIPNYEFVKEKTYLVIGHCYNDIITLEFEPQEKTIGLENPFSWLDYAEHNLKNKKSLEELLNETLIELKKLTHFNRLMIYKFDKSGAGKVIAEVKDKELEPFLGLHFPAIDIPPVARKMFFNTWTRHIPNVNAKSIDVIGNINHPLDMSYTFLRGVSPCHVEYLNNMGVEASLGIALIQDGNLWGLLTCHHTLPKFVGFHRRNICQLFGRFLSLIIPEKEQEEVNTYFKNHETTLNKAILTIHSSNNFFEAFQKEMPELLKKIDACGLVLSLHYEVTKVGQVPEDKIIQEIIETIKWSPDNLIYKQENQLHYSLDVLNGCYGYISFRIPEMGNGCLILFRREYAHTINWAGNPNFKSVNLDNNHLLTPRASFALFLEEIKGKAKKWEKHEIKFLEHFIAKLKDEIILFQGGELKKTTSILKTIYEDSMDALFLVDINTDKIVDCNDQAISFFEVANKDEVIGRTGWDFHLLKVSQEIKTSIKEKIKSGISIVKEIKYKIGKKKIKWGSLHAKVINNTDLDVYMVRVIDITDKKDFEARISLKNEELIKLNKELDRFVYSSSHDLRAPITSLTGLFSIIEQLDDRDEIIKLLQHGKKSLNRLDKFIHDILNYSRNTRLQVKTEKLNLYEIVEGIMADYRFMYTENPVEAKMDVDTKHEIVTDAYRIKVILNNIISNAFKYRNPYISESYVHVIATVDEKNHQIIIKDNGLGIGKSHIESVFDMFYRADDQKAGSGLGLYIVKEMIEKLGGTISLNSEINKGSAFMIELPKFK